MPAKQLEINKKNNFSPAYFGGMYALGGKTASLKSMLSVQIISI